MTSAGIDTEANFAPDGKSILFTSDRGGSPQIYRLTLADGRGRTHDLRRQLQRVAAAFCPTARASCSCAATAGASTSRSQDFATRQVQMLTQGSLDESPSIAPNGKLILYASENGGRGILAAVSSDGRVKQRLTAAASDVREPAWGPLPK